MDRGRDAGIAAGGALRQADDARVNPAAQIRHVRAVPLSLLPLLLLLGACGTRAEKGAPLTRRDDDDAGLQDNAGAGTAPPLVDPDLTPQARANLIRMCLKALSENTLQPSAIDELCALAGLGPGNRDLIDSTNDVIWQGRPLKDGPQSPSPDAGLRACVMPEDDELLVWRFIDIPEQARAYAGRVRETPPEVMTAETRVPGAQQPEPPAPSASSAPLTTTARSDAVAPRPEADAPSGETEDGGSMLGGLLALLLGAAGGGGGGGGGAASLPVTPPLIPTAVPSRETASAEAPPLEDSSFETPEDPVAGQTVSPAPLGPAPAVSRDAAPQPVLHSISGTVHDGPVQNASVYVDVNRSQQYDSGDVSVDPQTDALGNYEGKIEEQHRGLPLVSFNKFATHVGSNEPLPDHLATPAGARVISPLTHIMALWPSMDDPIRQSIQSNPLFRDYDPLQDNIFDPNFEAPYEALIKEFLVDLNRLIIKHPYRIDLKDAASNLLREYANRVADLLDVVDTPLELARDPDLRVSAEEGPLARLANNLVELRENSPPDTVIYRVAVPDTDVRGNRVHLWLDGADAADFTLTQTGELRLKAAADFETKPRYVVTIRAREVAPDAQPGADERLAEAIVRLIFGGLTAADTSRLATKTDLAEVRTEIADLRSELKLEIASVRSDLLRYMIGLFLAQAGLLVAVLRFCPL